MVVVGRKEMRVVAQDLADASTHAVAGDGVADFATDRDAEAPMVDGTGRHEHHEVALAKTLALRLHAHKVTAPA